MRGETETPTTTTSRASIPVTAQHCSLWSVCMCDSVASSSVSKVDIVSRTLLRTPIN